MIAHRFAAAFALATLTFSVSCTGDDAAATVSKDVKSKTIPLTIKSPNGAHTFRVEMAKTSAEQEKGLMFRTDIPADGGMLFAPYPPEGGPPRAATFWMKNTPTPLDIIFIRADGTIATIAENTVPYSEDQVPSGEPIGAVLELLGGKSSELGIAEGDTVLWPGHGLPK